MIQKTPAMTINHAGVYFSVVLPGLEPGISGPESDVLPLHHRTKLRQKGICFLFSAANIILFEKTQNNNLNFTSNKHSL